jgi:hypothetical protein
LNNGFRFAKDIHYDRIKLKPKPVSWDDTINGKNSKSPPETKYSRAARLGLCFGCFYEGTDLSKRPANRDFGFCEECMIERSIGVEKLERKNKFEVRRWFKD